jgi:hypothetical protein
VVARIDRDLETGVPAPAKLSLVVRQTKGRAVAESA